MRLFIDFQDISAHGHSTFLCLCFSRPVKKEPSMYQRLSAHLTSVELLSDLREISRISSSSTSQPADQQHLDQDHHHHRLPNPQWMMSSTGQDQNTIHLWFIFKKILDFYFCVLQQ